MMTIDQKITKTKKNEALDLVALVLAPKIKRLKFDGKYTYTEIAEISSVLPPRISELVQKKNILSERTLVGLISGGFARMDEIVSELKGRLDDGQERYVRDFVIHELGRMKSMLTDMLRRGDNPERQVETLYIGLYGEDALKKLDASSE